MRYNNLFLKRIGARVLILFLIVNSLFVLVTESVSASEETSYEIVLNLTFSEPEITQYNSSNITYHNVTIEGLPSICNPGQPVLPMKPLKVLLPQKTSLDSITATYKGNISIGEGYNVKLGSKYRNLTEQQQNSSNESSYNKSIPYPNMLFYNLGIQNFRGYAILMLNLFPVHYVGETGEIYYYEEMNVTIKTVENGTVNPLYRDLERDEEIMKQLVDDYSMEYTYDSPPVVWENSSIVTVPFGCDYVIITTDALKNPQGQPPVKFQDLRDFKKDRGTRTTIVTVDDINNSYDGIDTQEKIRNFIIDAYRNWEIDYVLIGGDNSTDGGEAIVPARLLWAEWHDPPNSDSAYIPSDLYYACLDGSYNSNENERWGEGRLEYPIAMDGYDIDPNGFVDLYADIWVGRTCVDSAEDIGNFVNKTLEYETTIDSYLEDVWLVGEYLWDDIYGGIFKDDINNSSNQFGIETIGIPYAEYNIDRLYDIYWLPGHNWPKSEIIGHINNGTHIINHLGHADYDRNMKMFIDDVDDNLTNDKYCFIYSQGCNSGGFDNPEGYDCIAEHFTVKNKYGAFAGIWNARFGYENTSEHDGLSHRLDRWFFDAIYNASIYHAKWREIGRANHYSKEKNVNLLYDPQDRSTPMRWCIYETNLFGDPQISIKPAEIPEHDVEVIAIHTSKYVTPDANFTIKAYILNKGLTNETNISVNFTVDETLEDNTTINLLNISEASVVSFNCSLSYGSHNISIEAQLNDVPDENITYNNILNKTIIGTNRPAKPETPDGPTNPPDHEEARYTTSTTDADGDQIYYQWKWDDGSFDEFVWHGPYESGEEHVAKHWWEEKGNYNISVIACDKWGALSPWSDPLPIEVAMSVDLEMAQQCVLTDSSDQFYGSATGGKAPYNWTWDFGDLNYSYVQNPTHSYATSGNYTVILNVTDSENDSANTSKVVNVVVLMANLSSTPLNYSKPNETISFNDTSDAVYEIINWSWDFGDGNISYEQNTSHAYSADGDYNVTLTVTDNQSNVDNCTHVVHIESTPPEITTVFNSPILVGISSDVTISADIFDNISGIDIVKVDITYPDNSTGNFSMNFSSGSTYEYIFSDTDQIGKHTYEIWARDNVANTNNSLEFSFNVTHLFGYNIQGSLTQNVKNRIMGSDFTVKKWGWADNVVTYVKTVDSNHTVRSKCMIYRNNDTKLIGTTEEKNISTTQAAWVVYNFSDPKPALVKGTEYILVCWSNESQLLSYDAYNDDRARYEYEFYNTTPPDPANLTTCQHRLYSIYCNYTPRPIEFVPPTPSNGSQAEDYIFVNISSSDTNQHYTFTDFNNDVVLWMRMDDVNSTFHPTDLSSYENNGTKYGDANQTNNGKFGKAFTFDGTGDYVRIPTLANGGLGYENGEFTLSLWVNTSSNKSIIADYLKYTAGWPTTYHGWDLNINNGKIRYSIGNGSSGVSNIDGTTTITNNEWTHIVVVDRGEAVTTGKNTSIYINGGLEVDAARGGKATSSNRQFRIGANYLQGLGIPSYFNGDIDEVMLLNRSLDLTEIKALYNASADQYHHNFTNLTHNETYNFTGYAADIDGDKNETETRSVTIDTQTPVITNVADTPDTVGFGFNVTVSADVTDNGSGLNRVELDVTYPDNSSYIYTMDNTVNDTYQYVFSDTWLVGQYNYSIWAYDNTSNSNNSTNYSFNVSAQATISIATLQDSYGNNTYINITDPPTPPEDYYIVDRGLTWDEYYNAITGQNVLEISTGPINYQDQTSEWTPINCTIELLEQDHIAYNYGYRAGNERGIYNTYFKPNIQDDWPVAFTYNKSTDPTTHVVRSKLVGVGYLDPSQNWAYEYLQSAQSSQGEINDNYATYEDVFTGTDVTWSYGNSGMKEEITMSNATKTLLQSHPPSEYGLSNEESYLVFITKLDYHNLDLYNSSGLLTGNFTVSEGGIDFKDAFGQFKCALPIGEAYELNDETVRQRLTYRILQYNGKYYLLAGLKVSDLNDMTFPVVVDPTLTAYSTTSDGYIYNSNSNYNTARSAETGIVRDSYDYIMIGQKYYSKPPTYYIYRGYVFFNTSSLPSNANITNATLALYKLGDSSDTDFDIVVQNGQPYYPHDPLNIGDYDKSRYSGNGGSLNTSNFQDGYNNISLTNYSWLTKEGTTKLCLRSSRDINGTAPTGYYESVYVYSSEEGGGYQPRLTIVYYNQSKIKNTGSTNISGYLLIQVQYNDSGNWTVDNDTVNETTPRTINSGNQLALDTIFNGLVKTNDLTNGNGTYRVYAAFRDDEGNILQCDDDTYLAAWWQFTVTFS